MRNWHLFYMYGMWGPATDAGARVFVERVRTELKVNVHQSPYRDYQAADIAHAIDHDIPAADEVFVGGTSLGCCDVPVVCSYVKREIAGAFGFQASIYGAKQSSYPLNKNVRFAHLIYSYNPLPFPGLGAAKWVAGTINPASLHLERHNLPHPGDGNTADQTKLITEMHRIMQAGEVAHV